MTRLHPGRTALGFAIVLAAAPESAEACFLPRAFSPQDVRLAPIVVVGRISHYSHFMRPYGRFDIAVDEILKGKKHIHGVSRILSVSMGESNFGLPHHLPSGPVIVALGPPSVDGYPEPGRLTVLVGGCAGAFILPDGWNETKPGGFITPLGQDMARDVRAVLNGTYVPPSLPSLPPAQTYIQPVFAAFPSRGTGDRYYPIAAENNRVEGTATLDCTAADKAGRLSCQVLDETPKDYGLGPSAVEMIQDQAKLKSGTFKAGDHIRLTWDWRLSR